MVTTPDQPYRGRYERGWRYSGRPGATLDHLDATRAPEAVYDGYLDRAASREKWHLAWCAGCSEHGPRAAAPGLNPPQPPLEELRQQLPEAAAALADAAR